MSPRFFTDKGYALKLSGGKCVAVRDFAFKLNAWTDAVIELHEGELFIDLDGHRKHIRDKRFSMKSRGEITFQAFEYP